MKLVHFYTKPSHRPGKFLSHHYILEKQENFCLNREKNVLKCTQHETRKEEDS